MFMGTKLSANLHKYMPTTKDRWTTDFVLGKRYNRQYSGAEMLSENMVLYLLN
jgi:hypothetical protein